MIKDIRTFPNHEQFSMLLTGVGYPMFTAKKDQENFQKFKYDITEDLSDYELREVNILAILEGLGYPMDELGTYLYKDMILEICEFLKGISGRRDMDKCRNLLAQLSDAYSQFYHNIAREDKEMGISSFHLYIQKAIDKIDDNSIDLSLCSRIFGKNPEEQNYGLQAFQIASYASQLYSYSESQQCHKPIVRRLSNAPTERAKS